jgi:hypothetical protein
MRHFVISDEKDTENIIIIFVPPYPLVIRSKTYRVEVKPRIITNAIYNVIFV